MPPVPTVGPSFRSLPCWLRRRRLNTSSPAAASGRGCPRPPARAPHRMTMAAAGSPRRLPRYRHAVGRTSCFGVFECIGAPDPGSCGGHDVLQSACHLPRARSAGCSVRAIRGPVGDSEAPRSGLGDLPGGPIEVAPGCRTRRRVEHQIARDTTTGAPKPVGARGAPGADTIRAAQSG